MKKLTVKEMGKPKANPLFKGMPKALKDPSCYADIEKRMRTAAHSDHPHKSVKAFVGCKRCLPKLQKRQAFLKELGFASYGQYLEWRRIMGIIIGQQNIQLS